MHRIFPDACRMLLLKYSVLISALFSESSYDNYLEQKNKKTLVLPAKS